jgi:hypothetical protein
MKFRPEGLATMAFACLAGLTLVIPAGAQNAGKTMTSPPKGATAGGFFKNVTTSTLKGLSPSDFLGAMGVMNAALGYDCSNCHPGAGTDNFDWVTDRVPQKQIARKMVEMVATINKQNFGGAQMVTCWTCHHGNEVPTTSIALDKLYGAPPDERADVVPAGQGVPPATKVLDDYIAAMGGAQKLAGLKSYIVSGKSEGYGGLGGNGKFEIYAEAPNKHGMWISFPEHPDRGISSWTYNGNTGWISQPRALLGEYELTGNDLAGAKLDATIAFPGLIKSAFPTWRIGPEDSLNGKDVYIVQGSAPGGLLGTFYFDKKTHLLLRYVRQTPSPVGRVTIQQDYDDYRDVNGIKFPFKYAFLWLDGRFSATISDVKVNVPIDAAKFTKP